MLGLMLLLLLLLPPPLLTTVVVVTAPAVKFIKSDSEESENNSDLNVLGEEDIMMGDRVMVVPEEFDDSNGVRVCD